MSTQGELTTRQAGERLVKLARIRSSVAPVMNAARASAQNMEDLYHSQGIKDPLYHDMKAVVGPLERLLQRADQEIEKILNRMSEEEIADPPDQPQNDVEIRSRLKRNLRRIG